MVGRIGMHAYQIGPADTAPPTPGYPGKNLRQGNMGICRKLIPFCTNNTRKGSECSNFHTHWKYIVFLHLFHNILFTTTNWLLQDESNSFPLCKLPTHIQAHFRKETLPPYIQLGFLIESENT